MLGWKTAGLEGFVRVGEEGAYYGDRDWRRSLIGVYPCSIRGQKKGIDIGQLNPKNYDRH